MRCKVSFVVGSLLPFVRYVSYAIVILWYFGKNC